MCGFPDPSLAERGLLMSTYEEFMIILTTGLLIVAILGGWLYSVNCQFAGSGSLHLPVGCLAKYIITKAVIFEKQKL